MLTAVLGGTESLKGTLAGRGMDEFFLKTSVLSVFNDLLNLYYFYPDPSRYRVPLKGKITNALPSSLVYVLPLPCHPSPPPLDQRFSIEDGRYLPKLSLSSAKMHPVGRMEVVHMIYII